MFFPAFSTVSYLSAKASFRLPFFRPGDLLCYLTGAGLSFYVIEEVTLDYILTTNKVYFSAQGHDEYARPVPTQVALLAVRKEQLPASDCALLDTVTFATQGLFAVQPSLASLPEYLQLVSSL